MSRRVSFGRRFAPVLSLLALGACTTVLGIEDVEEDPNAGDSGNGNGGNSTTDAGGGTKNTGGSQAGSSPLGGGESDAGGGPGPIGGDGMVEGGKGPIGGDGNAGGAGSSPGPVHGRVIDFYGHPVPNVPIQIVDAETGTEFEAKTSTDANGAFVIDGVPGSYEASVAYSHVDADQTDAWVYRGLTRRDPTLQIYKGSARRYGEVDIAYENLAPLANNQTIWVALGGDGGSTYYSDASESGYDGASAYWYGATTANQTAHGLVWQYDDDDFPTSYLAYDSHPVALSGAGTAQVLLDLATETVDASSIQGTVTAASALGDRNNSMFLRFTSTATMQLLWDYSGPDSFAYLAPSITGSSITLSASDGDSFDGALAIAHVDGLAPGAKPKLAIPPVMTPRTPLKDATGITTETTFTYDGDNPGPYVVQFYSQGDRTYQAFYIVTAAKQTQIPAKIAGDFSLYAGERYVWRVATHGEYASVDAMAGETGFLDEFSYDEETPIGPLRESGAFTNSGLHSCTMAP
jgi:hypothetical protein